MGATPNRDGDASPSSWSLLALALAGGVIVPGVVHYVINAAGYGVLADVVWVGGYAVATLGIWWLWIRPLDLVGSAE